MQRVAVGFLCQPTPENIMKLHVSVGRQRMQVDGTVLTDAAFDEMVLAYRASRGL